MSGTPNQLSPEKRFLPPLWEPMKRYAPGARVVFGGHIWIKRQEPGLWDMCHHRYIDPVYPISLGKARQQ